MRLHIRQRPGMYVGGANAWGLRNVLADVVTELLAAPGSAPEHVRCTLEADGGYAVELRGGAMPVVEPVAFDADRADVAANDPLFGLAVASALSARLEAAVVGADGSRWSRAFAAGVPDGPLDVAAATSSSPPSSPPLVRIRYRPDTTLFPADARAAFLPVSGRTRDRAAFHPRVRFTLDNEADGQRRDYHYPDGLLSLAQELEYPRWMSLGGRGEPRVWRCRLSDGTEAAEAVFVRRLGGPLLVHSFVNGYRTAADGTHIDGLRDGVAAVAAAYPADDSTNPFAFAAQLRDPLDELTVLLSVRLDEPHWQGSTKDVLEGNRPRDLVRRMLVEHLPGKIRQRDT